MQPNQGELLKNKFNLLLILHPKFNNTQLNKCDPHHTYYTYTTILHNKFVRFLRSFSAFNRFL